MNNRRKFGFTLIEVLVVIAIIGILASLILAGVSSARKSGHKTKVSSLINQLTLAINSYELQFGDYPQGNGGILSSEQLYEAITSPRFPGRITLGDGDVKDTDNNGKKEIVDFWGTPINYYHHSYYSGAPREGSFRLISAGEDCKLSTDDDITNFE